MPYTQETSRRSASELLSDVDHESRIKLRIALEGVTRRRIKCKRCNKLIPESRPNYAIYCSVRCQRNYRRDQITALRTEMRGEYRIIAYPKKCACGAPLNNAPGRHGPPAKWCSKRCASREAARRYRARRKFLVQQWFPVFMADERRWAESVDMPEWDDVTIQNHFPNIIGHEGALTLHVLVWAVPTGKVAE